MIENAESFTRIDLDLSGFEKERNQYNIRLQEYYHYYLSTSENKESVNGLGMFSAMMCYLSRFFILPGLTRAYN